MENSSKALTIAGGVLIAILVTTLLVFGLSRLRSYQNKQDSAKKNEQTSQFNSQFESYNKKVVTGYELISLGRMAQDTNHRLHDENFVDVNIYMNVKGNKTEDNCIINGCPDSVKTTIISGKTYYDVIDFTVNYYNKQEKNIKNQEVYEKLKIFKEAYFKCDKVEYDDKVDKDHRGSGRVIAMYFSEITKKE